MAQLKRDYETTFIINASLEDAQIETVITQATEIITRNGGELSATNRWGRKRLAYTIKKKNNGYYVHLEYVAPGQVIPQLERMLLLDENILRFLTIQLDKKALAAREQHRILQVQEAAQENTPAPLFEDEPATPNP
jgi:small subunit ribosomal protein S6